MISLQVKRGFLANIEMIPPLIYSFAFNPESMTDNKSVNYKDSEAELCGNAPGKVYTGGGDRTITFKFQLHGTDGNIERDLATLRSFVYPKADAWAALGPLAGGGEEGKRLQAPPTCFFGFGKKILECVVTELSIDEKRYNSKLEPVQADVSITLAVIERKGHVLFELDKQRRLAQAALGSAQSVGIDIGPGFL